MLSLYNAAHMATPGERVLDEAISFCRRHLESMRGELASPLAEQVSRALDIPLPRLPKRLEMVRYIVEYEEEGHDPVAPGAREARLRPRQGSSPRGAQGPVLVSTDQITCKI